VFHGESGKGWIQSFHYQYLMLLTKLSYSHICVKVVDSCGEMR